MVDVSPLTLLLQSGAALLLAVVLQHFYRFYRLDFLHFWARSWWALCLHLSSGILLVFISQQSPLPPPLLRLIVSSICYFAGFMQIVWLLLGTYGFATGRQVSRTHMRAGTIGALVLTLIIVLPFAFDPSPEALRLRLILRLSVRSLSTGLAFLGGAYGLLYGWTRRSSLGVRLAGWAFAVFGLNYCLYAAVHATALPQFIPLFYVGFFDAITQSAMGLGLVIWFLEEERDKAVAATAALRESHGRIKDLAGKLIVAQEEERKTIARELHDDLSQQLASLAIGLGKLDRQLPCAEEPIRAQIAKLEDRTSALCDRVRRLSHELHSSTLEHVGLEAALKLYCAEFSEQEEINVQFTAETGNKPAPLDAAYCLYRVTQEALRNTAKHSGAKRASVTLRALNGFLELRVADSGRGFDLEATRLRRGLGLVSMEERVSLLHGRIHIDTKARHGTEVCVRIPLTESV